jgi:hypothetical protein
MKIHKNLTIVGLFTLTASLGAQITFTPTTPFDGPFFGDKDGNLIPAGNEARIGSFADGFDYEANANDLQALLDNFSVFESTQIDEGPLPFFPSGGGAVLEQNLTNMDTSFAGQRVHIFVFLTADNSMVTDFDSIIQYGVFGRTSADALPWVFPGDGDTRSASTAELNEFVAGAFLPGSESGENYDMLTLIPEPKIYAALFGLLSLGFALYRRRKSTI